MSRRVVIAPLGEQPAGVMAPLLSLRLQHGDSVLVLYTEKTERSRGTERQREWLETAISKHPRWPPVAIRYRTSKEFDLGHDAKSDIEELARDQRVVVIANGGRWQLVEAVVTAVESCAAAATIVVSRDDRGVAFDLSGGTRREFPIASLGFDSLFDDLLRLRLRRDGILCPKAADGRRAEIYGVDGLEEKRGLLYAAIDVDRWPGEELVFYRKLLSRRTLLELGLDRRRLFLHRRGGPVSSPPGQKRAGLDRRRPVEDGIPAAGEHIHDLQAWRRAVARGIAVTLPEQRAIPPFPAIPRMAVAGGGGWTGEPMLTTLGPQPGSTLTGLWLHRPRRLYVAYDERHPEVRRLAAKMAANAAAIPAESVSFVPLGELPDLSPGEPLVVDTVPGDKLVSTEIFLWRRAKPEMRVAAPPRHSLLGGEAVPLRTWVEFHAPAMKWGDLVHVQDDGTFRDTCHDLLVDLSRLEPDELGWLNDLRRRRTIGIVPYIEGSDLIVRGDASDGRKRPIPLVQLGNFGAVVALPRGDWFEHVLAAALARAGIGELYMSVHTDFSFGRPARFQRDDLDVATRAGTTYTYWSCKTGWNPADVPEAEAQADRLLSWSAQVVLALPRLREEKLRDDEFEKVSTGHWRSGRVHLLDARTLADYAMVADIAAGSTPSRPRAEEDLSPATAVRLFSGG